MSHPRPLERRARMNEARTASDSTAGLSLGENTGGLQAAEKMRDKLHAAMCSIPARANDCTGLSPVAFLDAAP